jgi:HAE1 family hydrophobic/amphiphilic exporter-1
MEEIKKEKKALDEIETIKTSGLARYGVHKPYTIFVAVVIIVILGVLAFSNLTTELFPNMNLPYMVVMAQAKAAPADPAAVGTAGAVERDFTAKLEGTLYKVSNVKQLTSISAPNTSVVIIEFTEKTNVDLIQIDVIAAIEQFYTADRMADWEKPQTIKIDPNMLPVFGFSTDFNRGGDAANDSFYRDIFIPSLERIEGIAEVSSTYGDDNSFSYLNGKTSYSFSFNKASDYPTTEAVKNIFATLNDFAAKYEGFAFTVTSNQGEYIDSSIGNILNNLLMGGGLAIIILFLFLRNVKMTLAIALSIPMSVIGTFVLMYFAGIGLNMISMAGLALAVGMLVDNSIVVLENVYRLREQGHPIRECAVKGTSQILGSITASTITTICVFLPMLFVPGMINEMMLDMAYTLAFALLASLVVAAMFLPAVISSFKIDANKRKTDKKESKSLKKLSGGYNKILHYSINHKRITLLIVLVLFAGSIGLGMLNGFIIMPATDQGQFSASISLNSYYMSHLSAMPGAPNYDAIKTEAAAIAGRDENGVKTGLYKAVSDALGADLDKIAITYSGSGSSGGGLSSLIGGSGASLSVNVTLKSDRKIKTGKAQQDTELLIKEYLTAHSTFGALNPTDPGVVLIFATDVGTSSGSDMGMSVMATTTLSITFTGDNREAINDVLTALQNSCAGIDGILKFDNGYSPYMIQHVDKKPVVTLEIFIKDGFNASDVQAKVDAKIAALKADGVIPEDILQLEDGFAKQMADAFGGLATALLIAVVLVFLVMVAMFQSFRQPLIVMATIPLAFTGGFIALFITGMQLSAIALIGFIVLAGVVVNNGIVLVEYINQLKGTGLETKEAIKIACNRRLRPIIMTALTTILALITTAIGIGKNGELMQPLAIVSIGGLLYATALTLLVVPALYLLFEGKKKNKNIEAAANGTDGAGEAGAMSETSTSGASGCSETGV